MNLYNNIMYYSTFFQQKETSISVLTYAPSEKPNHQLRRRVCYVQRNHQRQPLHRSVPRSHSSNRPHHQIKNRKFPLATTFHSQTRLLVPFPKLIDPDTGIASREIRPE